MERVPALPLPTLGTLERVELRTVWQNESAQFTPWLSLPENIRKLGAAIGMDLEVDTREKPVGPYWADILCKETITGRWVVIENQLERTDHAHLGQLLTYAAGLTATTVVWVAATFTEEHRAALDWLNSVTEEDVSFFGLEVEAWRIGESLPAPKFNVVSKPNDWTKSVTDAAKPHAGELTEAKALQLEFWTSFHEYAMQHATRFRPTKPRPQNWMAISIGRSNFGLCGIASHWDNESQSYDSNELRVDFNCLGKGAKPAFKVLLADRPAIERELGQELNWVQEEDVQTCSAVLRRTVRLDDRTKWQDYCSWLTTWLDKFHEVFQPRVLRLTMAGYGTEPRR